MSSERVKQDVGSWDGRRIELGESADVQLVVSESYSGMAVRIPVFVKRGPREGPAPFITAAVHGDEINGTGAIRSLIADGNLNLLRGTLVLVPVINVLGFERHSRYLPDRRDLNRCFPGAKTGSLASRLARSVFDEIVSRCDFGIDLHTAAIRRTNFPHVRGDLSDDGVRELATAAGCEVLIDGKGPKGCFRRATTQAGCPTLCLEAGEVWKVEPAVAEYALRGIHNVLIHLGMIEGQIEEPAYRTVIEKTKWVRANSAGFLQFHVAPGALVKEGTPLATATSLLGRDAQTIEAPRDGLVIGMTTLPVTAPGEPVLQIGCLDRGTKRLQRIVGRLDDDHLHQRIRGDLATNFTVVDPEEDETPTAGPEDQG